MNQNASNVKRTPAVAVQRVVRCVEVSKELQDNLAVMKRLIGDKWEASAAEYKTIVSRVMIATNDDNPISCALPMAKEMSRRGHSPLMLLAVATEMSEAPNAESSRPAPKI